MLILSVSLSLLNTSSFAPPSHRERGREGVSSPLKTEIPKSAAAAASLGEASSHRFSPSLLPSTTQRMAGWLLPSIPSYFFLSFLPFFSTLYIRIALLSPFRKTSLSRSPAQMKGAALSFFLPPSLQHFPLSCSHFSRAKEEAKWEMGVQKCAGGGREASDSRREGLDKQTCAVSERTAAQIPRRTPRRPRLFSPSPVPGLNVMSVVHTLRHRRLWILREGDRDRIRDDHATCSCYPSTTASLATAAAATAAYNFSLSAARSETNLPCLASLLAMLRPQQRQHGERPS